MKSTAPISDFPATAESRAKRWGSLCLIAVVLGGLPPVTAQGAEAPNLAKLKALDLEDLLEVKVGVVYAASKFEQKTTEAPSSVSVVSSEEIKRYGYRTLGDILASLQGFHVSNDRNYSYLGVRGVSLGDFNSRVLLLVDGHRVNNNLTDGAFIGTESLLDVDLFDRVEVIRGPGSVLYGNNAFFGVINIITRKGGQIQGTEVSGDYGEFGTYKGRVSIGKAFTNGVAVLLSGSYYQSVGERQIYFPDFDDASHNNGVAQGMDGDKYKSFFGSLSYRDFTLQGGFINRKKINPTAVNFTTFNDPRVLTVDERSYVDLKYAHEFPHDVNLSARVYYDRSGYQTGYPLGDPVASAFFEEAQNGEWWGAEVQLGKKFFEKHIITVGAEYRDDFRQEDVPTWQPPILLDRKSHGVFAQGDFTLLKSLHLNGGVRYDQYGSFDPSFSPRLGLIYNPLAQSTFKALYGTAFRAPNFVELIDPRFQNIEPEKIRSYELVYEQGIGKHLRSSLAGYFNEMENLILLQDGRFNNVNADTLGMEMALEGNWSGGVRGRASYTLQRTENRSGGPSFPDSPQHLVKFNLSVPVLRDKLFASLEYQYVSSRQTVYATLGGTTPTGPEASGYSVVNFTLFSQNLLKNLEVSAGVYNLLDSSYSDPSSRYHLQAQIPQAGRSFRLKATYKF